MAKNYAVVTQDGVSHGVTADNVAHAKQIASKNKLTISGIYNADGNDMPVGEELVSKISTLKAQAKQIADYGTPDSQYSIGSALMPHNATLPVDAGRAQKIASGAWDLATFLPRAAVAGYRAPHDQPIQETLHTIAQPYEGLSGIPKAAAEIVGNPINYLPFGRVLGTMKNALPTVYNAAKVVGNLAGKIPGVETASKLLNASENLGPALAKQFPSFTTKAGRLPPVFNVAANTVGAIPRSALEASAYTGANVGVGQIQAEPTAPFLPSAGIMTGAGSLVGGVGKSLSQILPGVAKSQLESIIDVSNKERKAANPPDIENLLNFKSASAPATAEGVNLVPPGNAKALQYAYNEKLEELRNVQRDALGNMEDFRVPSSLVIRRARQILDEPSISRDLDESERQQVIEALKLKNKDYQAQSKRENTPKPIGISPEHTTQVVITPDMRKSIQAAQTTENPIYKLGADAPVIYRNRAEGWDSEGASASMSMGLAGAKKSKTGREASFEYVNDPNKTNVQNTTERIMNQALRETMLNEGAIHLPSSRLHTPERIETINQTQMGPSPNLEKYKARHATQVGQVAKYREGKKVYEAANADFTKLLPWQEPINREVAKATNRGLSPSEMMAASAGLLGGFASGNHGASVAGLSIAGLLHYSKTPGAASAVYNLSKQLGPDKALPMAVRMGIIDPAVYQANKGK